MGVGILYFLLWYATTSAQEYMYRSHPLFLSGCDHTFKQSNRGMTQQWIGIEEAAEKYQLTVKRINSLCNRKYITCTRIGNYTMVDENSLIENIEQYKQFSLTRKELLAQREKIIETDKEELFILQSMKELTPISRLVIKELAEMIHNDERRRIFLYIALHGNLLEYAEMSCQDFFRLRREFPALVREVKTKSGFLKNYKTENTRLKAKLRLYEMKFGKEVLNNVIKEQTETDLLRAEKEKKDRALLETSLYDLELDGRAARAMKQAGMDTLQDLLKYTYKFGIAGLNKISNFGPTTERKVTARLREMNILDNELDSYLYKYLDK